MPTVPTPEGLRRGVLAVSVLRDLDLLPTDDGILLTGEILVDVPWSECERALADDDSSADPESAAGHDRLARWLLPRRWLAGRPPDALTERIRPVGLPAGHVLHPGRTWVRDTVLGNALDLGVGLAGLDPSDPDRVVVVPPGVYEVAGITTARWWERAADYLAEMGRLAAERWLRDPTAALKPMGDCDVVTLLGSAGFRSALAGETGGMCAAAVPMRDRGWTELRRIDPAFVVAAAAATTAEDRGFPRPLLLTADEVTMVPEGGRPAQIVLRDAPIEDPWVRTTRSR